MKSHIRSIIWRYYAFNFLLQFAFFSGVLIPFFTQWGHLSFLQITLLQSWFSLWVFILEVPTGAVADHLGRKYSLALGALLLAVAAIIYGSIPRFEIFLLSEFLFAAGMALASGADKALLYDTLKQIGSEEESKKIFGRAHVMTLLGIGSSAPIGSIIAAKFGLNSPMLVSAVPFLLASIIAWSMKEPLVQAKQSESTRYLKTAKEGFLFLYTHKILRIIVFDAVLVASAGYFVVWLYQPLLQGINMPISYFGFGHVLLITSEILIASNFVRLEKLFGSGKAFFKFGALAVTLGFFLVAVLPNLITIALFLMLAGGFGMTRLELMTAYMNRFISPEKRATVLSSVSMLRRFSIAIFNPLVGAAIDHSLSIVLFTIGLLPLIVFLFSPLTQEHLEDRYI